MLYSWVTNKIKKSTSYFKGEVSLPSDSCYEEVGIEEHQVINVGDIGIEIPSELEQDLVSAKRLPHEFHHQIIIPVFEETKQSQKQHLIRSISLPSARFPTLSRAFTEDQHQTEHQVPAKPKEQESEINLSFCGCGFLGIYHVGVASCFHEYAPHLSAHKISGSSAGALVAVAHMCGNLQLAYATTDILRVVIDARARNLGPFHPSFDIDATVREALEHGLPDDVHLRVNGKLHVSLTRVYDGENVIISHFDSKEDVIQVLLCSCFIPIWSGFVAPKYKGISYIDGGFSNNLLCLDDKTVTVSPFSGEADICPTDESCAIIQLNIAGTPFALTPDNLARLSNALLPPSPEVLSEICEQGFADCVRFLEESNLLPCTKPDQIKLFHFEPVQQVAAVAANLTTSS